MKVIDIEDIAPFDVDLTLVMPASFEVGEEVRVLDPVTGKDIVQRAHEPMIRLLKEAKQRGSYVVVWSRGGYAWATNVVKALNLQDYVDLVMSKPRAYYDDTPIDKWLVDRVYLDPKCDYKKSIV